MNVEFVTKKSNYQESALKKDDQFRYKLFQMANDTIEPLRIKEEDFSDVYSQEEIQKDLDYIKAKEDKNNNERDFDNSYKKEIANYLEGAIVDMINRGDWLGKNIKIVPASRHDDYRNGIDGVLITKKDEQEKYLGLGFDITFSSNPEILKAKLDRIKETIDQGYSPSLKYFRVSENRKNKKFFVPKIIIGERLFSAEQLLMLWGGESNDKEEKLKNDPIQSKIILQSIFQLRYFSEYAEDLMNKEIDEDKKDRLRRIALSYAEMHNIFHDIYESKKELIEEHFKEIQKDPVYKFIAEYTGHIEKGEK